MVYCPSVTFSIFTPVTAPAASLQEMHDSLAVQSFRDFEWLILDFTFTDQLKSSVKEWQLHGRVPIRYLSFSPQQHWHSMALALHHTRGELLGHLSVGSSCSADALELLAETWHQIPDHQRREYAGISTYVQKHTGEVIGKRLTQPFVDCSGAELEYEWKVRGPKWTWLRPDLLHRLSLPGAVVGERTDSFGWTQVYRSFKTRHLNEPLAVIPRPTQPPQQSRQHGSPSPLIIARDHALMILNLESGWIRRAPIPLLKVAFNYIRYGRACDTHWSQLWHQLKGPLAKTIWLLALPWAFLVVHLDSGFPEWMEKFQPDTPSG
jgi:hypothetical protein